LATQPRETMANSSTPDDATDTTNDAGNSSSDLTSPQNQNRVQQEPQVRVNQRRKESEPSDTGNNAKAARPKGTRSRSRSTPSEQQKQQSSKPLSKAGNRTKKKRPKQQTPKRIKVDLEMMYKTQQSNHQPVMIVIKSHLQTRDNIVTII
jgi:hypothetical protein